MQFHAGLRPLDARTGPRGRCSGWSPAPSSPSTGARCQPGDALLLYTDGLVETPTRDITYGIDKLLGEAEKLVKHGFEGGADRLVESVDSKSDDRALFLLHRR